MRDQSPTIAVLGAGPIGLESALYGRFLGYDVQLYEREEVGHHIMQWGHVHWFTPFGMNHSPLSAAAIEAQDPNWKLPGDQERLTGREYVDQFLKPLAETDLLARSLHRSFGLKNSSNENNITRVDPVSIPCRSLFIP